MLNIHIAIFQMIIQLIPAHFTPDQQIPVNHLVTICHKNRPSVCCCRNNYSTYLEDFSPQHMVSHNHRKFYLKVADFILFAIYSLHPFSSTRQVVTSFYLANFLTSKSIQTKNRNKNTPESEYMHKCPPPPLLHVTSYPISSLRFSWKSWAGNRDRYFSTEDGTYL